MADNLLLTAKYRALLPEAAKAGIEESALVACFTLLSVADAVFAACHERLARYGLSEGRFAVLLLLRQSGAELTPSALAHQAGVTRATMTGLLDGLVREGFVNRAAMREDRRSLAVSLTAKGKKTAEKAIPLQLKWLASLFAELPLAGSKEFLECLQIIGRKVHDEKQRTLSAGARKTGRDRRPARAEGDRQPGGHRS